MATMTTNNKPTNRPTINNDLKSGLKIAGIYDRNSMDWLRKFHRFGLIDPYNRLYNTREYVFFTKPNLNIFQNGTSGILNTELNTSYFNDLMIRGYSPILRQLQYDSERPYPFMNILSNSRTSNLDLPGINSDDVETAANLYGTRMYYRKNSITSDENFEFSLEFEDTKYGEVYYLLKTYDEYQRKKFFGEITAPTNYTLNKILHDQISIFKFIVNIDDNNSLLYWAKLYGCYPKSVPREVFSELPIDGPQRYNVQWKCSFVEDMEPAILSDFNILAKKLGGADLPIYNTNTKSVNSDWATIPYIVPFTSATRKYTTYRLKWKV